MTRPGATCPACDSDRALALGRKADISLHRCARCELVFVHPQPRETVRHKYVEEYDVAAHFASWESRKRVLYDRRLATLPQPAPGRDRLCDVGCGDGQFLQLAAARGWRVHGIELNPPAAAAAKARGAVVTVGVLEELADLPWEQYDLVTSWDVLEHTPFPKRFSEHLVRLLTPGGTLAVTTLNYDSLARRVFGLGWSMVGSDHFTYWNARSLRLLFQPLGVQLLHAASFGIGRDFVSAADRFWARRHSKTTRRPGTADAVAKESGRWDVNPVVLAAERGLNLLLGTTGTGVGVEAAFRKPESAVAGAR